MPVHSMTGYASLALEDGLTVECRSVNGRFLDLSLKIPDECRALEPAVRDIVSSRVKRGKVELRIAWADAGGERWSTPAAEQLERLADVQAQILRTLPSAQPLSVADVLALSRSSAGTPPSADRLRQAVERCVASLLEARAREGARLVEVLLERVGLLEDLARQAAPLIPAAVERQQQKFLERWREALGMANQTAGASAVAGGAPQASPTEAAAHERALSEAATYALRIDVAEELARLQVHLTEIRRLLQAGGEVGKRLDFLIQELHREANTLGSKSTALELSGLSMDMKVAIEQMREQVQNLE